MEGEEEESEREGQRRQEGILRSGRLARIFSASSLSLVPLYSSLSLSLVTLVPSALRLALSCHFGSPRGRARLTRGRPRRPLPIVARCVPPRRGKQCLISVNAAIMAVVAPARARNFDAGRER